MTFRAACCCLAFQIGLPQFCYVIDESFASHTIDLAAFFFFAPFMAFNGISTDLLRSAFFFSFEFGGTIAEPVFVVGIN